MTSIQPPAPRAHSGKVAIVTGSTSGIGYGILRALAEQGCTVIMNGLGDPAQIENMRADASATFMVPIFFDDANIAKPSQARKLVRRTVERFGRVDILVNNAGVQFVAPIDKMPLKEWNKIIAINLTAPFVLSAAVIPHMRKNQFGRIINISSAHGLVGSPGKAPYCSSKHGLNGLSKVAALDVAIDGITVNAICPGWVDTPLFQKQVKDRSTKEGVTYDAAYKSIVGEKQPNKKATTVEQIGAMSVYLCSDAASTVTGTALSIDGGWVAE